jgi:hypothetical protein
MVRLIRNWVRIRREPQIENFTICVTNTKP